MVGRDPVRPNALGVITGEVGLGKTVTIRAAPAELECMATEQGRLDILVNYFWGGELFFEWDTPV